MRNETSAFYFRKAELGALANGASLLNQQQRVATSDFLKKSFIKNDQFVCSSEDNLITNSWHCYAVLKSIEGAKGLEPQLFKTISHIDIQQLSLQNLEAFIACWNQMSNFSPDKYLFSDIAEFLEMTRCEDMGWSHIKKSRNSSIFGCWLAFSSFQLLEKAVPQELKVLPLISKMRAKDGLFSHQCDADHGSIPSTYFAVSIHQALEEQICYKTSNWIMQQQADDGGFLAAHIMPFGDVQSTAQALLSLKLANVDITSIKSNCLQFLADHLHQNGGFVAHCREQEADATSTFYGLVALGLLDEYISF